MALSRTELESITRDFFMSDGGKAFDQYFGSNYLVNKGLKSPKKRPSGGNQIKVPLTYDRMAGGSFSGADQFDTSRRDVLNSAIFPWKNYYTNVTVLWDEELENNGPEEEVDMVVSKLEIAQKSMEYDLGDGLYSDGTGNESKDLTGLKALFNTTTSTTYGGIAQDDMSRWSANASSTSAGITSAVLRACRTAVKIGDGAGAALKAGFQGIYMLDNAEMWADGKCPSGYCFCLNSRHWGFAVHAQANFVRTPWKVPTNQATKSMQILWKGNMICTRRNAHYQRSGLTG